MIKTIIDPDKAYNDLPNIPPQDIKLNDDLYVQLIKSHKVLAELKGYSELLPNKNIILNSITLEEAKDSSEIENIITTHDELYKAIALKRKSHNPAIKEVLNYRRALFLGMELIKEKGIFTTNMIIAIQQEIEENEAGLRKLPGTKLMNDLTGEIRYTPPDDQDVIKSLMRNLEEFINIENERLDPLIRLAIIHYQFEAIHPFYDGNGRTGRIINVLYLILEGLLNEPFLYLSSYIIRHKPKYYSLLHNITYKGEWEPWLMFMLQAIETTAKETLTMSENIIKLFDATSVIIKNEFNKIYTKELVEVLFSNVYCKISDLVDNGIASRNIASNYLKMLETKGILKSVKIGREVIYINEKLFELFKNPKRH
ncbi:MAG: Fic/DOC family N-terminal domain-containing protein [Candidatus Cloacimonadales bacterium]|nr:Fic/DOC family N-terminal domain-containing protein [Candidatus Cloacimonadales bacterium]